MPLVVCSKHCHTHSDTHSHHACNLDLSALLLCVSPVGCVHAERRGEERRGEERRGEERGGEGRGGEERRHKVHMYCAVHTS